MFSTIMTWIGAILGISLLVTMAFGGLAADFAEAYGERRRKPAPSTHDG